MPVVGDESSIRVERASEGVALVVLDRPEQLNALDADLFAALPEVFGRLADDEDTRVVILTGAGSAFCAGADLAHHGITATDVAGLTDWMHDVQRGPLSLYRLPQPTIAAVNGVAAGGGLGLALACDIRIAGANASFTTAFARIAVGPDFGTSKLLPRTVGVSTAMELLFTSRRVDAVEALQIGLVSRIEPDALAASVELADTIAAMPPQALRAIKSTVRRALELDYETVVQELEPGVQATLLARLSGGPEVTG